MFTARAQGSTLRRSLNASRGTVLRRKAEVAVHDPHDARERFDPEFVLALQCQRCGKHGQARRKDIHEAIRVHIEEECPRRHVASDEPVAVRVFYPKQ